MKQSLAGECPPGQNKAHRAASAEERTWVTEGKDIACSEGQKEKLKRGGQKHCLINLSLQCYFQQLAKQYINSKRKIEIIHS